MVMKQINVLRKTGGIPSAMENGRTGKITLRTAVYGNRSKNFSLYFA